MTAPDGASDADPLVRIDTALGPLTVAVAVNAAPLTAANFLAYVDRGLLDGTGIHRIVAEGNQPSGVTARIAVVQFGLPPENGAYPAPLPHIPHETTAFTGLRHRDGTLSAARFAAGSASSGFFFCVGDQPSLDHGGARHPDGLGFAAFGRLVEGRDVLAALHARAEASDRLACPIPVPRAVRVAKDDLSTARGTR